MALLYGTSIISHSRLTFVYTFLHFLAVNTSSVFTFYVNRQPLRLHFKTEFKFRVIANATTSGRMYSLGEMIISISAL